MEYPRKERYDAEDLLRIVQLLRGPGGCPWDREQTHRSIRPNLLEETYEAADAIDQGDMALLCEELGDVLLQVALHAVIAQEAGSFTFGDVCDGICQKLIYRHPHVFGSVQADTSGQVLKNWEKLKNDEKGRATAADRLDSVPASLPALMRSAKVQKRAADYGFGYKNAQHALEDLRSEVAELAEAMAGPAAPEEARKEVGDVLFSAVNVARLLGADAEEALTASCSRFAGRVKAVEAFAEPEEDLAAMDDARRDSLWRRAKAEE